MSLDHTDIDSRLAFFGDLLSCQTRYYLWNLDPGGDLLDTNCPDLVLHKVLQNNDCWDFLMGQAPEATAPVIMSISLGLMWAAAFEREDGQLQRIHILGPVFTAEPTRADFHRYLDNAPITARWRPKLIAILQRVPVVSITQFYQQAVMLHYCVTGEQLLTTDVISQSTSRDGDTGLTSPNEEVHDRMKLYMAEKAMLHYIREGDVNFQTALQNTMTSSRQASQNIAAPPLIQAKVSRIVFATLCSRAAMEGGLSPEIGYTRSDEYIQDILNAQTISEVSSIGRTLYEDFIHLVRKQRTNPDYSKPIQSCVDYIEGHLGEDISISLLAGRIGYADYYLSRKFKEEVGVSVNDYIKFAKVERARMLLSDTQESIQDISDALGFSNRNFFSETFRKVTGTPPAAYRKEHQRL